ncbi:MAG: hypothetical protein R3C28_20695 [Pirellulaceae bacterium]
MALERQKRQGVLLLIVLSLLVLFALIGITFIVVANQYDAAAKLQVKVERTGDAPDKIVRTVMLDMLRGSTDLQSPFYRDSLLGDLYGNDGFRGEVLSVNVAPDSQQLVLEYRNLTTDVRLRPLPFTERPNQYSGTVLTFTTGSAAMQSRRVIRSIPPAGTPIATLIIDAPSAPIQVGQQFVVTGKPFNGTGSGYDVSLSQLNLSVPGRPTVNEPPDYAAPYFPPQVQPLPAPAALLPFSTANAEFAEIRRQRLNSDWQFYGSEYGGSDESYDAADYQNIYLASIPPNPLAPGVAPDSNDVLAPIIPSMHRPHLVQFWMSRLLSKTQGDASAVTAMLAASSFDSISTFRRDLIARPLPTDHPYFTGSNPAFDFYQDLDDDGVPDCVDLDVFLPDGSVGQDGIADMNPLRPDLLNMALVSGPWDIDNDNDGIADSIWIDPGLPIQTTSDGKLYKPLVAVLCIDLDGKINVNAHGMLDHLSPVAGLSPTTFDEAIQFGIGIIVNPPQPQRGLGYGPAEVNVASVFGPATRALLEMRYTSPLERSLNVTMPGDAQSPADQVKSRSGELLSQLELVGVPADHRLTIPSLYNSPFDIHGRIGIAVDQLGQPIYDFADANRGAIPYNVGTYDARTNTPYEVNLVNPNGTDDLYSVEALEVLYRGFDADVRLSQIVNNGALYGGTSHGELFYGSGLQAEKADRLAAATRGIFNAARVMSGTNSSESNAFRKSAHLFTTHSFDIPQPNFVIPDAQLRQRFVRFQLLQLRRQLGLGDINHPNPTIEMIMAGMPPIDPATLGLGDFNAYVTFRMQEESIAKGTPMPAAEVARNLAAMLPPEIRDGGKLDVNRLFGNGEDDNGDDVVDDAAELLQPQTLNFSAFENSGAIPGVFAYDPNGETEYGAFGLNHYTASRQMLARHLYCMVMFLMDQGYTLPFLGDLPQGLSQQEFEKELTAQRIAQWAINAVDFRDPDSAFTPFEYDVNPLDGWDAVIDGNPGTDERAQGTSASRRLVWGCEYPELLLTETAAFHNRRVKDTNDEALADATESMLHPDDQQPARRFEQDEAIQQWVVRDQSLDQYRIPQGSAFIELYCTRSPLADHSVSVVNNQSNTAANLNSFPRDLYRLMPGQSNPVMALDLGLMSIENGVNNVPYPVWRLAISEAHREAESPLALAGRNQINNGNNRLIKRDTVSFVPERMSLLPRGVNDIPDLDIERIVWFAPVDPSNHVDGNRVYWNRSHVGRRNVPLRAGQYAVIGPRLITEISSDSDTAQTNGRQQIVLGNNSGGAHEVAHRLTQQLATVPIDNAQYRVPANNLTRPLTIISQASRPANWTQNADPLRGIGLNISEPIPNVETYYSEPPPPQLATTPEGKYETPIDLPFDERPNSKLLEDLIVVRGLDAANAATPSPALQTGTVLSFKTVFLQRLADPKLGWNPLPGENGHDPSLPVNPYLTTDWMPIDLTIFNGEDSENSKPDDDTVPNDPFDLRDPENRRGDIRFRSRQRGGLQRSDIWPQHFNFPTQTRSSAQPDVEVYFDHDLVHTFGIINQGWSGVMPPALPGSNVPPPQQPQRPPFTWLAWNNRPYANAFELMQVPATSPSRLLHEYGQFRENPYRHVTQNGGGKGGPDPGNPTQEEYEQARSPFGHLLNFLHSDKRDDASPNLIRLFEFVETPSRFLGTKDWLSPIPNPTGVPWNNYPVAVREALKSRLMPFNYVRNFRDPGKVNVNTVTDVRVLTAVEPDLATAWSVFKTGRQGVHPQSISSIPTSVSQPFRSPLASDLSPIPASERAPIDVTMFRTDEGLNAPAGPPSGNLGGGPSKPTQSTTPLLGEDTPNSPTHSYFWNQDLRRLGNLTTTHSNVYAVWITVGYFEVMPWNANDPLNTAAIPTPDLAHPDGYQLGRELGSETGQINRDRAFYIIDRSIPVGFEKGQNHNVDQTILLERFIED